MSQIRDGFKRPTTCDPSKCDSCRLDENEKWVCYKDSYSQIGGKISKDGFNRPISSEPAKYNSCSLDENIQIGGVKKKDYDWLDGLRINYSYDK